MRTCATLAVPTNIAVSILLVKHYGAAGPLLATFSVGLLVQTLPGLIYARNRHRTARHRYVPSTGVRRAVLANEPVINASTVTASDPYMALVEEVMAARPARPLSPFRAWEKDPVKLE